MAWYRQIVGPIVGYDQDSLLFKGQPVGVGLQPRGLGRGRTFYVDSAVAAASGSSPREAVATIVAATALCTANQGDTVVVMPYHAESITAATALTAVAGTRIIGLGVGAARPTVTFTTANTAAYSLAVAGTYIENILFIGNFLSIASAFLLTTAANTSIVNCEFRDAGATTNFLNIVKSTGAANTVDGLLLAGNTWFGLGTTSVNSFLLTANDINRLKMFNNYVQLARTATAAVLVTVTAGVLTAADITWNTAISAQTADTGGGLVNVGGTTSTGRVSFNHLGDLSTTDVIVTTTVGLTFFENRKTGVITATGYVIPTADS